MRFTGILVCATSAPLAPRARYKAEFGVHGGLVGMEAPKFSPGNRHGICRASKFPGSASLNRSPLVLSLNHTVVRIQISQVRPE